MKITQKTICLLMTLLLFISVVPSVEAKSETTTMYAPDGRSIKVYVSEKEAYKKVGWYENKSDIVKTLYAPDGRSIKVYIAEKETYKKLGWYENRSDVVKTMYAPDGRETTVFIADVDKYKSVGWYTYPVYVADGSMSKPFLAKNKNTIDFYQYSSKQGKIIFNVTGFAKGNKAEAIGGLENAEDDQEWILLKVKVNYLEGQNELTYFTIYDWLYNKSGSKYNVYDKEYDFGYSWNKDGDIYNKGIRNFSTFPGGSMEGYVAVLTDAGAKMPIIKIPTKDGNMFVSTIGAPELVKKTKEQIIAEHPVLSKCKLELPALPATLSNSKTTYVNGGYKDVLQSKFTVSGITYEFKESSGGKVDLHIYYKGEKTFDVNGPGQTSDCKIGWKLYDSDGYVLKDGTTYTMGIAMNEKFKDVDQTIYSLEPGSYKLVIMGVNGY